MIQVRGTVLGLIVLTVLAAGADARQDEGTEKLEYTGKVTDIEGKPLAGARAALYELVIQMVDQRNEVFLRDETITGKNGRFDLTLGPDRSKGFSMVMIVVQKEGKAAGWASWQTAVEKTSRTNIDILLEPSTVLGGTIIDEQGNPIDGAKVIGILGLPFSGDSPKVVFGGEPVSLYSTSTGEDGRFTLHHVPENATAEFIISAPGRGTLFTGAEMMSFPFTHAAGTEDIEITLPAQAVIEGMVVEKESGKPVAGARLIVGPDNISQGVFCNKVVVSRDDGTFRADGLIPGPCLVKLSTEWEGADTWTAEPVRVVGNGNEPARDIRLELVTGGGLEVTVQDGETGKPIAGAYVVLSQDGAHIQTTTENNGMAKLAHPPGKRSQLHIFKDGYKPSHGVDLSSRQKDDTTKVVIKLERYSLLSGMVRDAAGDPVAGAVVTVMPFSFRDVETDEEGKFEVEWDPSMSSRTGDEQQLLVRHIDRNLAAIVPLKEEGLEIGLFLATSVTGQVTSEEGGAIRGARIGIEIYWGNETLRLNRENIVTNSSGFYEIRAIPAGTEIEISATARGYGSSTIDVLTGSAGTPVEGRKMVLLKADLTVAGIVVDADGKPAANVSIQATGSGQNSQRVQTDTSGRFVVKGLCKGPVDLTANTSDYKMFSSYDVEAGTTDVRITLEDQDIQFTRDNPSQIVTPLAGRSMPALDGTGLEAALKEAEGKRIVLCFFDMNQRPSRHGLKNLAEAAKKLADSNCAVFGIDLSGIDAAELEKRAAALGIAFPLGSLEAAETKTASVWGIKGLPWYIVIDASRKIRAVGVDPGDIEAELDKTVEK